MEQWDSMKAQNMGLLLWGGVGTGKSFFAGCIANALLAQGVPVLMTNFAKILGTVTGMYGMERQKFLSSLNTYSLLILDDLGAERNSEYALEQLFGVVDSRYQSRKPMIVTTNLTLEELRHPSDLAHERIYDRLLERCVPVKMKRGSRRSGKVAAPARLFHNHVILRHIKHNKNVLMEGNVHFVAAWRSGLTGRALGRNGLIMIDRIFYTMV